MSDEPTPRIIVDEDWKAQAQAEKEAAERNRAAAHSKPPGADESSDSPTGEPAASAASEQAASEQAASDASRPEKPTAEKRPVDDPPLPAASFSLLITTLATQAMSSLGLLPEPGTQQMTVRLNQAKHAIDMLDMLEKKTEGNLAAEETEMLADVLHQLRLAYVSVKSRR